MTLLHQSMSALRLVDGSAQVRVKVASDVSDAASGVAAARAARRCKSSGLSTVPALVGHDR